MVVDEAPGEVVVVELPAGAVVLVVVLVEALVVVVFGGAVDVVVVVLADVVVVCDGVKMFPLPELPKIDPNGLPEISSMAMMSRRASTNTTAAVPAMTGQENDRRAPVRVLGTAGNARVVVARRCSVAGASASAEISSRPVCSRGAAADCISTVSSPAPRVATTSVGASTDDAAPPLASVPPSLRRREDDSGARTTTCLTASWPRSMDCATSAVPMVAAADPMATPMMVPLTPKVDAMTAAITAPATEARI